MQRGVITNGAATLNSIMFEVNWYNQIHLPCSVDDVVSFVVVSTIIVVLSGLQYSDPSIAL